MDVVGKRFVVRGMTLQETKESFIEDFEEHEEEIKDTFSAEGRYSDWGISGSVDIDGEEHNWIESEEEAESIALDIVRQDLENEPEIFNRDWLLGHIDTEKYLEDIRSDIEEWTREDAEEDREREYSEEEIEEKVEEKLKEIGGRLLDWLENDLGYTGETLWQKVSPYLDLTEAAQDAIDTDGWAHFLSTYDGEYETTNKGVVFFRE